MLVGNVTKLVNRGEVLESLYRKGGFAFPDPISILSNLSFSRAIYIVSCRFVTVHPGSADPILLCTYASRVT